MVIPNLHPPNTVWIRVSGELRPLSRAFWESLEGPKPSGSFKSNGCTSSPDYLEGKPVWPACVIHDYHYNGASVSREQADSIFRRNVCLILREEGMNRIKATAVSWLYWFAVRKAGRTFYNGKLSPA